VDEGTVFVVYMAALGVVAIFALGALAWLGAQVSTRKGYGAALGAALGVLAGPIGLVIVLLLPDIRLRRYRRVLDAVDAAVFPDRATAAPPSRISRGAR